MAGASTLALVFACKDATQVRVIARTNVPYRAGLSVGIWTSSRASGTPGELASTSAEPWLNDGQIGDLVVTPRDQKDGPLSVRMVLGVGRDPGTCTDADAKGCIVAKRKLAFVPGTGLRLPMVLHLACEGVVCSDDTTCNYLGQCVSAVVDPSACASPEGCVLPGDEQVTGVAPQAPDASADVRTDTSADSANDANDAGDANDGSLGPDGSPTGLPVVEVAAGNSHACARFNNGTVKCWGNNQSGQLGTGIPANVGDEPNELGGNLPLVDLGTGRTAVALACGAGHTCARLDNNQVKCWGSNDQGQLGLGDTVNRGLAAGTMGDALPTVDLGTGRTAVGLAAGSSFTCATLDDGTLKCWGVNFGGQLGLGDALSRGIGPGQMGDALPAVDLGPSPVAGISLGSAHVCARLDDGTLKCWGDNVFGRLGLGDSIGRGALPNDMGANLAAVDLGAGRTVLQVGTGISHTCARLDDGTVKCWGFNFDGQLGLGDQGTRGNAAGTMGNNLVPVPLGAGTAVAELAVGALHNCARLISGTLKCWGQNTTGQLGVGDTTSRGAVFTDLGDNLPPVDLGAPRQATQIAAGTGFSCALLDDATVKCWGANLSGELGQGDTASRGTAPGQLGGNLPPIPL